MATNTNPVTNRFYPRLSEVMSVDDLPDFLGFAQDDIDGLLDSVFYKNLQFSKSKNGDSASFSLDVVTKSLGLTLPFGLRFVLNPDQAGDSSISSFPISLQYQWQVLAFLRSFNLSGFSFDLRGFFELGLSIFSITDLQVITNVLNVFVNPDDLSISKYQQLVADVNSNYVNANLTLPSDQTPSAALLLSLINDSPNIAISVPELMFQVYILDSDSTNAEKKLQQFYNLILPGGIEDYIQTLIKPKIKATLTLSAGLEFPLSMLKPVDVNGNSIAGQSIFEFDPVTISIDTDQGIGTQFQLGGSLVPMYAQIANTGLIIRLTDAILDLSQTTNIPEATAAGYPVDFMGIYIKQASISFGKFGTQGSPPPNGAPSGSITATNMLIGTGGVSGTIALVDQGVLYRNFGDFAAELDAFSITFRQNSITNCSITGSITLPNYKTNVTQAAKIAITAQIKDDGSFSITAVPMPGLFTISLPNVFDLHIRTLTIGEQEGRGFYAEISGTLDFTANIPILGTILPKNISITKLRIWDNGEIDFNGGFINVPKTFSLKIGPVKMEVSKLSAGAYTKPVNNVVRHYAVIGFDGMVNTGNAGIDVSGNGIKYYFTVDSGPFDNFISIEGIEIDITVPGNASPKDADFILKGFLKVSTPPNSSSKAGTEYAGSVSVSMPRLGISGSAGMRLDPSVPSYLVDMQLALSSPLLLGSTGLGIYGFRGLIGSHYLPDRADGQSWWDYYKASPEGISIQKFTTEKPGFSVGAGVSVATSYDSGFTFSSKLFLLLGVPDVFLIQGQAGILQARIGLDSKSDPPFSALIAIDSTSFTGNLAVNYNLPSTGSLRGDAFMVQGTLAMAFFFNNASGWYINIGQDTPESARVQAKILTLFKGYAYLMISAQGFKAGAGTGFNFNKSFGPIGLSASASLDMGVFVSFKPVQIGGFIQFTGSAGIKFFFFKISIALQVTLAVEAPHPFNLKGTLTLKIHTPWPLPNIHCSVSISWTFNNDNSELLAPVDILQLPDPTTGYSPAAALNIMSLESFPINYVNQVYTGTPDIPHPDSGLWKYNFADPVAVMQVTIPLDSYIDIDLLKPVMPGQVALGGAGIQLPLGYTELLPPVKGISNQVSHSYSITGLTINVWRASDNSWQPYNIYEAVTAIVDGYGAGNAIALDNLPLGYWQFAQPNTYNKIRLLAQTMFSYTNLTDVATSNLDGLNFQRKDLFCFEQVSKQVIVNWKDAAAGTTYAHGTDTMFGGLPFYFTGLDGVIANDGSFGNSLSIATYTGSLTIEFPEPVTTFEIDFGANQNNITIYPVTVVHFVLPFGQSLPVDINLSPIQYTANEQNTSVTYNQLSEPVSKIVLEFNTPQLSFSGDLLIGSYFQLPARFLSVGVPLFHHEYDQTMTLMYAALYSKAFSAADMLVKPYNDTDSLAGRWTLTSPADTLGLSNGIVSGNPDIVPGFFIDNGTGTLQQQNVYAYSLNTDGLAIPHSTALDVEGSSFSVDITAVFDPYVGGISTLLSKVYIDPATGGKKGYALHIYQDTPGDLSKTYAITTVPTFSVIFSCYDGESVSGIVSRAPYTLDYTNSKLLVNQYKNIVVSVNRTLGNVTVYVDKLPLQTALIPAELAMPANGPATTYIDQLSYYTEVMQASATENNISEASVVNEVQMLSNNLNKTVQPVWRPNTTFAVTITTRDTVNGNTAGAVDYTQIFGFRTAGPVGLFQQQSAVYQNLVHLDRADEFKLAGLASYIDYNRSSPDAQGRYNLSKPVLYSNPQVSLFFTMPYVNAMYYNWTAYQQLPAVESSLQVQLIDPLQVVISEELIWTDTTQTIGPDNYTSLPQDQQLLYLLDNAASEDSCNPTPLTLTRNLKQGAYTFPPISPGTLYTAVFNAVYQPAGAAQQVAEVHKFSFVSSIFGSFAEQAGSFILDSTPGQEVYAIYPINLSLTAAQITQNLIPLLDIQNAGDTSLMAQFGVQYDRIIYGGMLIKTFEPSKNTIINPIINTDPATSAVTILGIIVRNPEPFNDPKLPPLVLKDTIMPTMTLADNSVKTGDDFKKIYAGDTSAVLITNANMQVSPGTLQLTFYYMRYNGIGYQVYQQYTAPGVSISINN